MIQSAAERPPKRIRLGIFTPFVATGAVSASRSSAVAETEYLAKLTLQEVETDEIFFPGEGRGHPDQIAIGKNVENALQRSWYKEEALRNAVYTDLILNHGISFPESSYHWAGERKLRSLTKADQRYKECDLAHILLEFHQQLTGADASLPITRLLHGLNVTTSSLPDMTILKENCLCFGEFKNSNKYTNESAAKQCTLYLFALIYFFRVRLGLDVKAVFGFWVCGPGCFTRTKEYSVGFIRLSAPEHLGDSLVPQVYSSSHCVKSVAGIQQLVSFLKFGNAIEATRLKAVHADCRIPALLSLPRKLWESPLLVSNGTASMVFRGFGADMLSLLLQIKRSIPLFKFYVSSVKEFVNSKADGSIFFLKIRLKDTTLRENPASTVMVLLNEKADFFREMFPIDPTGDGNCGIILMNNCGDRLGDSAALRNLGFRAFCTRFAVLWQKTIAISDAVLHGDSLPHNIVYNAGSGILVLIDYDEGIVGSSAHKRIVEEDEETLFPYLRYPNFLRAWRNRQLYTKVQLVASFLLLQTQMFPVADAVGSIEGTSAGIPGVAEPYITQIVNLHEAAKTANSFLKCTNDDDPMNARGVKVAESVYLLVELFQATMALFDD